MKHEHYVPNLGEAPAEDARRDAVHIAVAPVVAGENLEPAMRVGFLRDGTVGECDDARDNIGVVDPYRNLGVKRGERFWLFLYPGTITGLRHVWSHPAFTPRPPSTHDWECVAREDRGPGTWKCRRCKVTTQDSGYWQDRTICPKTITKLSPGERDERD